MVTGERQAARIRALYLKTILRQDIAFFDMETNGGGEVVGRMSGDTVLIQNAMGEKVRVLVQKIKIKITWKWNGRIETVKCVTLLIIM